MKKITYCTDANTYKRTLETNLEIRQKIADLLPFLSGSDREKYEAFFKYSEKLEKRVYFNKN